ncbi:MAG: TrkA C-terminal domain-containing protein [Caldilineaceae bacterium]|nr:TrkA C-terminal domain-containing protein [Caldilineaceae bacterium]
MLAIVTLLLIITLSILVTRVATIALAHTGLSRESARFQARSAFTGTGFATHEAEKVVNHPVRRRIILLLMLLGNAGIVSAASTLILTFVTLNQGVHLALKVVLLMTGLTSLWMLGNSEWADRQLSKVVSRALQHFTDIDVRDYASLMHFSDDYRIVEIQINPGDWLADRHLRELRLRNEGVVVLGIVRRDGTYIGAPVGQTKLLAHDTLIAYGRINILESLDRRRQGLPGFLEHQNAVVEQRQRVVEEIRHDPAAALEES